MQDDIFQMINTDIISITNQVAGISLAQSQPVDIANANTLSLSAKGTYQLNLFLYASWETLAEIAGSMKHMPAADEEVPMYTIEYFNILGGGIISKINRRYQLTARFTPPVFWDHKICHKEGEGEQISFYYRFQHGSVIVTGNIAGIKG